MTGHLLVPALDPDLPATLSPRILGELLRDELGFSGVVVTDAVEMRAVADRYGFAGAAVRALAAGADAICVGGERADEAAARELRDAIVAAVLAGELPEERLAEAAKRVGQLAAWTMAARAGRPVPAPRARRGPVGLAAARRAVRVTARHRPAALPLTAAAHVVEFEPPRNIAIGAETPWGIGAPLADLLARHHHRPLRRGRRARRPERRGGRPAAGAGGARPAPARLDAGRGATGRWPPARTRSWSSWACPSWSPAGAPGHPRRHPGRRPGRRRTARPAPADRAPRRRPAATRAGSGRPGRRTRGAGR